MQFYFDSFQDFLQMSGHGPYVWAAFIITWVVLCYLLLSPWLAHRRWLRRQGQLMRRREMQKTAQSP